MADQQLAKTTSDPVDDIDRRHAVIKHAIEQAADLGADVSWRDLVPVGFLRSPQVTVTLGTEFNGEVETVNINTGSGTQTSSRT